MVVILSTKLFHKSFIYYDFSSQDNSKHFRLKIVIQKWTNPHYNQDHQGIDRNKPINAYQDAA